MTANSDDRNFWVDKLDVVELPAGVAAHFAGAGTEEQRLLLASNRALPGDVALVLAHDPLVSVRGVLAGNDGCETEVLAVLGADPGVDAELVAGNWNAPISLKLNLPLWKTTRRSLDKFALTVHATVDERERLLEAHARSSPRSGAQLKDAWYRIRPIPRVPPQKP